MIKKLAGFLLFTSAFVSLNAVSGPLTNPDPAAFGEDIDGSGYFLPMSTLFLTETLDIGESLVGNGNVFGFYFQPAAGEAPAVTPVFDSLDADNSEAVVNFGSGLIIDVEDNAVQDSFLPGTGPIGFFAFLPGFGNQIFYSDPSLNAGGADYFGAFPLLSAPDTFGLLFADPSTGGQIELVVAGSLESAAVAPQPVPAPGPLALLAIGLLAASTQRKFRKTRQA